MSLYFPCNSPAESIVKPAQCAELCIDKGYDAHTGLPLCKGFSFAYKSAGLTSVDSNCQLVEFPTQVYTNIFEVSLVFDAFFMIRV